MGETTHRRAPVLYLAPWVDYGGTDKGTIDWFKWLDRERFAPLLVTTQPSENRRLAEVIPYAEEVWPLPDLMAGGWMPKYIFDLLHTREVEVLHIMNSRLGFDLLPDLAALPRPPKVVVQLHVEEQDKSGYVRYVTTRYGNLVDAFSLTSQHLADAVERYDVPRAKCRVIYTGVDAESEFNPELVEPIGGLEPGTVHVLYPGRLVDQKDPLLMVDVVTGLRDSGLDFRVHVVGEGPLEPDVRSRVAERGLEGLFRFHPPTQEIARWFAACDLLLMTSVFEGVPYVIYEAMAMGVPIVAPALPGNVELMDDECGALISPRGHADRYVEALTRLIADAHVRTAAGVHARARVRERFSLERMGAEHGALYDELIGSAAPMNGKPHPLRSPAPIRMRSRPSGGTPLVSVIVPCFNHGRYLRDCLDSIRDQTYPAIETIVVDDASSDPQTVALIERLENQVTVLRMPRNSGPSAARNAAIDRASGRYILPVDADNKLLPDAVERLVSQLQGAGERVGYVYPNLQYFGNRSDYYEAPEFNLRALLQGNFADTSSLLDREVFDAGLRYPEDIVLGHEDWDFALSLAEREVYGEPARAKTLLYRKTGFTRSDVVEYAAEAFHDRVVPRHRCLFDREGEIKARWAPGMSIVLLEPLERELWPRLEELAARQTCLDFELVVSSSHALPERAGATPVRRIPAELPRSAAEALETAIRVARGGVVLVSAGGDPELLADPCFVEKLLVFLQRAVDVDAIVLADAGERGRFPLRLLHPEEGLRPQPHAVLWRAACQDLLPDRMRLRGGAELSSFAGAVATYTRTQWRHAPAPAGRSQPAAEGGAAELRVPRVARASEREERENRLKLEPRVRKLPDDAVRRWTLTATWIPPETELLCRHVSPDGNHRVTTNQRTSPRGYHMEYDLGGMRRAGLPGTARLLALSQSGSYEALPLDDPADPPESTLLGYVETAPLPLFDALILGVHRGSGQHVLVAGDDDPIMGNVEPIGTLGFVESYPINPRHTPHAELPHGWDAYGVLPLTRAVDRRARRHVYAVGGVAAGELAGELGALEADPPEAPVPVWITAAGQVLTDRYEPAHPARQVASAARWVAAPMAWRGFAPVPARARASGRRVLDAAHAAVVSGSPPERSGPPVGYLSAKPVEQRVPIHSAIHPVTGDQLLTSSPLEAADMGYGRAELLGYALAVAPLTGRLGVKAVTVPWASRFGHNARR